MHLFRRATQRAASFGAAIASVLLLATCDLDKIVNVDTTKAISLDSTELALGFTGGTTVAGVVTVPLGGTATVVVTASTADLSQAVKRYVSATPTTIAVDSITGVMTGLAVGTAKITARVMAPELGAGVTRSQNVRVRFAGIKVVTPVATDSIPGLGQTRTVAIQGTNNAGALVVGALTADSLRLRTAGVADTTILRLSGLSGTTLTAKKNGTSYVVAYFDGLKDSMAVRVRQVAAKIQFPGPDTTTFTARHLNFNLSVPLTVKDVADSIIPTPTLTWRTKDTTKATVGATTGVLRVKSVTTDSVWARMDAVERGQRIVVAQVAGSLFKFAGDAQTDTVGLPIAIVPTVTVLDSGSTAIVGASVLFKPGVGLNASVQDTLQVSDANGRAKPTAWKLGTVVGPQTLLATSGAASATFNATAVNGVAKKLAFTVNPTSATIGVGIAPAIVVQIQDSLGNVVTGATNVVTLALSNNPGAATLAGTLTATAVNGVATFPTNISLNAAGTGYTLQASSGALTVGVSNGFDVFGVATKLGFTTQPAGTTAGATMSTVRVSVQDASGTTVSNSTASVTISFSANPGSATLGGTLTVAAVAGVASFTNLTVSTAASGYVFQATAPGLTGTASNAFTISAVGTASKLGFSVQPSNVVAGAVITPAVKVQVLDVNGGLVTTSTQQITLSIEATSPAGGTIGGTVSRSAIAGVATFDDITINKAGTAFKLLATAGGTTLSTATSSAFNVTPGTVTKLGFVQQPTHTTAGVVMSPAVTVELQDAGGNRVTTGSAVSVTLAFTSGTCTGATLTGGGAQNTASGVATFSSLSISTVVNGCGLTATASGLTSAASTSFNSIAATGAARLSFTTEPSSSGTAGVALSTAPIVAIQDASGNNVTATASVSITLSVLSGPQTGFNSGTTNANTTTTTSFPNLVLRTAGAYRLIATATGFRPDTSAQITINPATAFMVGFVVRPGNVVAGVPISPAVVTAVQDQFGNTIPGATNQMNVFACNQTICVSFTGTSNFATASNGVATYNSLAIRTAAAGLTMCVQATALNTGCSNTSFDVSAAPVSALNFVVQPPSPATAGTAMTPAIQVQAEDSVGNKIADFSNAITVALSGGTSGAALSGTKIVAPTGGISTFSTLSIDKSGTLYKLIASASGVSTATSNAFTVNAGAAAKLAWITQPAAITFLNAPLAAAGTTPAQVAIQDLLGNTVTSDGRQVSISVAAGPSFTYKNFGTNVTSANFGPSSGIVSLPFPDLQMTTVGTGYTLQAAATGLTSATSTAFQVQAFDAKAKLAWNNQPNCGQQYRIVIRDYCNNLIPNVFVLDQYNNLVTSATDNISIAIGTDANPTTTLSGGGAIAAAGGAAAFPNLTLNKTGNGYTLVAAAAGLTSATSFAQDVTSPGYVAPCCVGVHWTLLGNTIYFTGNNAVKSVSVNGGPVTSIIGSTNAAQITNDGTNVFWVEHGTSNNGDAFIKKYTVATSTVSTLTVALSQVTPWSDADRIYTDGTNVYFTAYNAASDGYGIRSIPVGVSGGTPTDVYANTGNFTPPYFLLSGGLIYFRDQATSTIRRMTTTGTALTTLTTGTVSAERYAFSGTTLFFNDGVTIKSIANAATASSAVAPTTVLTASGTVYDVAANNGNLYFNFDGSYRRYSPSNFTTFTEIAVESFSYYYSFLFDTTDIYFYQFGRIAKLPK